MPKLTKSEFEATFDDNVEQAGDDYRTCLDFWDYVDALSMEQRDGFECIPVVDYIFLNDANQIEHLMLRTDSPEHYLNIVLDKAEEQIPGRHLFHADFEAPD